MGSMSHTRQESPGFSRGEEVNGESEMGGLSTLLATGVGLSLRGVRRLCLTVHDSPAASEFSTELTIAHGIDGGVSLQLGESGELAVSPWIQAADMTVDAPAFIPSSTLPGGGINKIVVYTSSSRASLDRMEVLVEADSIVGLSIDRGVLVIAIARAWHGPIAVIDAVAADPVEGMVDEDHQI